MNKTPVDTDDSGDVVPAQPGKDANGGVMDVPKETLDAIEEDSIAAGGEWQVPEEFAGSVGTTMFDMPNSKDGTVTVLLPQSNIEEFEDEEAKRMVREYDPKQELVVVLLKSKNRESTYRVRTGDQGST